jgi:hypothetical protein
MILARDAVRGAFYRRPRGESPGRWMEVPAYDSSTLKARLSRRLAPSANDVAMLVQLTRRPDLVPLVVVLRGTDPMTGDRYETRPHVVLVPGDVPLRQVASRPGFGGV